MILLLTKNKHNDNYLLLLVLNYFYYYYYYYLLLHYLHFLHFFCPSFFLLPPRCYFCVVCYTQSSATSNERWARNTVIPDVVCTLIQVHGAGEEKELPYTQKKARELSDRCQRILDTPYTTVKTRDK